MSAKAQPLSIICPRCEERFLRQWAWCRECGLRWHAAIHHPDYEKFND